MTTIKNILFPVDFSPACAAMVPFVQRATAIFGAHLTLLYVLEPCGSGFELVTRPPPDAEDDRKNVACAKLQSYLPVEFPSHEVHRLVAAGEAAGRIAAVARDHGFDLIVMPTHAGVFRRMLLGSTTAKVLNDSDCIVLTTQHGETIAPRPLDHREWLVAIGLSADSERVLRLASQLAETVHANLSIVHAVPPAHPGLPVQLDLAERVQAVERHEARDRLRELQRIVGTRAHVTIAIGPTKEALTEAARRHQADALLIGRSSQPGTQGRLRDLTYAVVRDAPCPVISI